MLFVMFSLDDKHLFFSFLSFFFFCLEIFWQTIYAEVSFFPGVMFL